MRCYLFDGRLYGTKAEAPNGAEAFDFPDDKQGKIDLVNALLEGEMLRGPKGQEAVTFDPETPRWRVYLRGLFACAVRASSASAATARALELMEVRRDRSGR